MMSSLSLLSLNIGLKNFKDGSVKNMMWLSEAESIIQAQQCIVDGSLLEKHRMVATRGQRHFRNYQTF